MFCIKREQVVSLEVRKNLVYLKILASSEHCSWSKINKLDTGYSGVMRSLKTQSAGP